MPIYEYEHDNGGRDACGGRFEALQGVNDPPLEKCPRCGRPCHRVLSSFAVVATERQTLSKSNLEEKGFSMYKKAGEGVYEKAAGKKGPKVIKR